MNPARQPWMERGLCREVDPEAFCAICEVRADCLTYVLDMEGDTGQHLRFGIWAGFTPLERARMARARRERRAA
jgi:hypothetical protein